MTKSNYTCRIRKCDKLAPHTVRHYNRLQLIKLLVMAKKKTQRLQQIDDGD